MKKNKMRKLFLFLVIVLSLSKSLSAQNDTSSRMKYFLDSTYKTIKLLRHQHQNSPNEINYSVALLDASCFEVLEVYPSNAAKKIRFKKKCDNKCKDCPSNTEGHVNAVGCCLQGIPFKKNDTLNLFENGIIESFIANEKFEYAGIEITNGDNLLFYDNGVLKEIKREFNSKRKKNVQGIPLNVSNVSRVSYNTGNVLFHSNQQLLSGYLDKSFSIRGILFPKGSYVRFDRKGDLEFAELPENCKPVLINGILFTQGSELVFNSGKITEGRIENEMLIGKIKIPAESRVFFDIYGHVIAFIPKHHGYEINGIKLGYWSTIGVKNDTLEYIETDIPIKIENLTFNEFCRINFFRSGDVRSGVLIRDTKIPQNISGSIVEFPCMGGPLCSQRNRIEFNENKKIIHCCFYQPITIGITHFNQFDTFPGYYRSSIIIPALSPDETKSKMNGLLDEFDVAYKERLHKNRGQKPFGSMRKGTETEVQTYHLSKKNVEISFKWKTEFMMWQPIFEDCTGEITLTAAILWNDDDIRVNHRFSPTLIVHSIEPTMGWYCGLQEGLLRAFIPEFIRQMEREGSKRMEFLDLNELIKRLPRGTFEQPIFEEAYIDTSEGSLNIKMSYRVTNI